MKKREGPEASRRRQEAFALLRAAGALLRELARPGPLIAGCFYEMYKKCGRPGCRCARGELHGPFPVLAVARGGRRTTRSVPRAQAGQVRARAAAYRAFQAKRRRLRRALARLAALVREIGEAAVEPYP